MEIAELSNEAASDIASAHEWRALTKIYTLTGDGVASSFALPPGYDRMAVAQGIQDPNNIFWGYTAVQSLGEWITVTSNGYAAITPGWWVILDDQFQFQPKPNSGAQARFAYISANYAKTAAGVAASAFTQDSDNFVLEDRLLTLAIIWRWKAQKGMEYAEDMSNYELALSQVAARDTGSQAIRKGAPVRFSSGTRPAWPWPLG